MAVLFLARLLIIGAAPKGGGAGASLPQGAGFKGAAGAANQSEGLSGDSRAADGERLLLRLRLRLMERERPREGPLRTFTTLGCLWAMLATGEWPRRVTQLRLWSPSRDCPAGRHSKSGSE